MRPVHPVRLADMAIIAIAVFGGALVYCLRVPARLRDDHALSIPDRTPPA